jgi:hypothetical protein
VSLADLRRSIGRDLNEFSRTANGASQAGAFNRIMDSLKETISAKDSVYANMLEDWQKWRDKVQQFKGTFGLKKNASSAGQLAKLLKSTKTANGMSLLKELPEYPGGSISSAYDRWRGCV